MRDIFVEQLPVQASSLCRQFFLSLVLDDRKALVAAKIHGSDTRAWNDGLARSNDAFIAWLRKNIRHRLNSVPVNRELRTV
jgi:hypothetical protein